jgi:hypothetical protein
MHTWEISHPRSDVELVQQQRVRGRQVVDPQRLVIRKKRVYKRLLVLLLLLWLLLLWLLV